jgi:triosephosphate isomerase
MFGIDSAKKVKILYSGKIDEVIKKEILEEAGVDGVFIEDESLGEGKEARIIYELTKK